MALTYITLAFIGVLAISRAHADPIIGLVTNQTGYSFVQEPGASGGPSSNGSTNLGPSSDGSTNLGSPSNGSPSSNPIVLPAITTFTTSSGGSDISSGSVTDTPLLDAVNAPANDPPIVNDPPAAVPEPSSLAVLLVALAGLIVLRRFKVI